MNKQGIIFILIFSMVCCGAGCKKDKDIWEEVRFEFAIPLTIAPGNDTITVGEELTLTAKFPDSLFDVLSQKNYYLPNFDFKTVTVIQKLTNSNAFATEQTPAIGKFSFSNEIGGFSNPSSRFADVTYDYESASYELKVKLTPKEKGVYMIFFYHSTGVKGSTTLPSVLAPSKPGIKRFPLMRVIRYTFNNGYTHFNIYKENCKPRDPNEATNWVESKATYTFVVK